MADQPAYDYEAARIRAGILRGRGAQLCDRCPVITQGGAKGMAEHKRVVHGDTDTSRRTS